jgi:hypothetical protein
MGGQKSKPCPLETVSLDVLLWETKTTPWGLDVRTGTFKVWSIGWGRVKVWKSPAEDRLLSLYFVRAGFGGRGV